MVAAYLQVYGGPAQRVLGWNFPNSRDLWLQGVKHSEIGNEDFVYFGMRFEIHQGVFRPRGDYLAGEEPGHL